MISIKTLQAFVFLLIVKAVVGKTACSQQYQCAVVSKDYNFATCDSGFCRCRSEWGFSGAGTNISKCGCQNPYSIFWQQNNPYCIQLTDAVAYKTDNMVENVLLEKVEQIYQSTIWPTPAAIMGELIAGTSKSGILANVFAPIARGRIDPLGEFQDYDGLVEYFYGSIFTPFSNVRNVYIQKLHATGNVVFARVILKINTYNYLDTTQITSSKNLTETAIFTFDRNNRVASVEAAIHNLGWAYEIQESDKPQQIAVACNTILNTAKCGPSNDPLGYYADMTDCISFMNSIKYGTFDKGRDDSVVCRQYHATLAIGRPNIHCPHTGKTGGKKCTLHNYEDYYLSNY